MKPKIWTLKEARATLPVVKRLTDRAVRKSAALVHYLESRILPENEQEKKEEEVQQILNEWTRRILALGAEVKGLWLVDFDNGRGYYCWRYGEQELIYEHGYEAGFAGRRLIVEDDHRTDRPPGPGGGFPLDDYPAEG